MSSPLRMIVTTESRLFSAKKQPTLFQQRAFRPCRGNISIPCDTAYLCFFRFLQFLAELRLLLDTQERISYFAEGYDIE